MDKPGQRQGAGRKQADDDDRKGRREPEHDRRALHSARPPLPDRPHPVRCSRRSICEARSGQSWIDGAADIDEAAWRLARALDNRPDASGGAFAIEDARADSATASLPFVAGAPGLRFMASLPLGGGSGRIALFDTRVRRLTPAEMRAFEDLAALAGEMLRLDRAARGAAAREAQFRLLAETSTDTIVRGNLDGVRLYISPAVRELLGYEPEEMIGKRARRSRTPRRAADRDHGAADRPAGPGPRRRPLHRYCLRPGVRHRSGRAARRGGSCALSGEIRGPPDLALLRARPGAWLTHSTSTPSRFDPTCWR